MDEDVKEILDLIREENQRQFTSLSAEVAQVRESVNNLNVFINSQVLDIARSALKQAKSVPAGTAAVLAITSSSVVGLIVFIVTFISR